MTEIRQNIINVMAILFAIDPTEIPPNAAPGVIERWDSLGHMNLVMALEEEFGIRFQDNQIEQLISIDFIELCVKDLVS